MKKRLAVLLPLAAVAISVMVYLLAARPWLITNESNTYDIHTDSPVAVAFESVDQTRGDYRIINSGSESVFCTDRFEIQCQKGGGWYKVKAGSSEGGQAVLKLESGGTEYFTSNWRSEGQSLPAGKYRLVTPIKTDGGENYWIAAPFAVS